MKLEYRFLCAIFLIFLSFAINVYLHENVHREVYRLYGVNSSIRYFDDGTLLGFTVPLQPTTVPQYTKETSDADKKEILRLQAQAEIVGYNFQGLIYIIVGCAMLIIMLQDDQILVPERDRTSKETPR
jgi:hypothetical protein